MKKWTKSVLVTVLSAVFLLGCMGTAWAIDGNSNFASSGGAASDGVTEFNLIKDYDSVHPTKNDTNSTQGAPYSSSPAETFVYIITPYMVWNAGNATSNGTTLYGKSNMPMLEEPSRAVTDVTYDNNTSRTLIVKQTVGTDAALNNTDINNSNDTYKAPIKLPDYTTVGDYWYQVVEFKGETGSNPTTGVFYGTNDIHTTSNTSANGGHTSTYYIHVQVTEKNSTATSTSTSGTPVLIKNVTLHKNAPDANLTNAGYNGEVTSYYSANKVNAIQNKYYAGQLQVQKVVVGNAGDKNQYFQIRVTFEKPAGTVVNSEIAIKGAYYLSSGTYETNDAQTIQGQNANGNSVPAPNTEFVWNKAANDTTAATAVAEFYVKDGTTVYFYNIPYGINYTVEEHEIQHSGYTNTFEMTRGSDELTLYFNGNTTGLTQDAAVDGSHFYTDSGETATNVGARGSIAGANPDVVKITNSKDMTIDIGVITENAPFIALIAVSGAVLFLLVSRKKKLSEV